MNTNVNGNENEKKERKRSDILLAEVGAEGVAKSFEIAVVGIAPAYFHTVHLLEVGRETNY